ARLVASSIAVVLIGIGLFFWRKNGASPSEKNDARALESSRPSSPVEKLRDDTRNSSAETAPHNASPTGDSRSVSARSDRARLVGSSDPRLSQTSKATPPPPRASFGTQEKELTQPSESSGFDLPSDASA